MISGHIGFFDVLRCGLYKVGNDVPKGCDLDETFALISKWVEDRDLADTIPWDPERSRVNKPKCYLQDITQDKETKDWFLVLWKSDTDSAGTLWGAAKGQKTGSGNIVKYTSSYRGDTVIWGRPCYYWIIPELNIVASLKFDHSVLDTDLLQDYVKACIQFRVNHANREVTFTEKGHARIHLVDNENNSGYLFRFDLKTKNLSTNSDALKNLAPKITHIVKRETVTVSSDDERATWLKRLDAIPLLRAKPKTNTRKIEIRAEAKPTPEELRAIMEHFAVESIGADEWENVGFEIEGGSITWVDQYRARDVITVIKDDASIITADELKSAINSNRVALTHSFRELPSEKMEIMKT